MNVGLIRKGRSEILQRIVIEVEREDWTKLNIYCAKMETTRSAIIREYIKTLIKNTKHNSSVVSKKKA